MKVEPGYIVYVDYRGTKFEAEIIKCPSGDSILTSRHDGLGHNGDHVSRSGIPNESYWYIGEEHIIRIISRGGMLKRIERALEAL